MILLILSAFLGFVQAVTEFLPISSSGHLILFKDILKLDGNLFSLSFDIILHLGTLAALILYFRKDLMKLLKGKDNKLFINLILATIPALVIGFFIKDFEDSLRIVPIVIAALIIVGLLFIIVEKFSKENKNINSIKIKDALLIGLSQCVAFIPGVSRSGATITGGLFLGLKREEAAHFSFLLAIPTVLIISLKDVYDLSQNGLSSLPLDIYVAGFFTSFITGFLVIKFLLNYLRKNSLKPFAYYRFALALVFLFFLI